MEFADLKTRSSEDLKKLLKEKRAELQSLRFKARGRELKTAHKLRGSRKTIARIMTLLASKK